MSPAAAAARPRRPVPTRLAEIADVVQLRGPGAPRRRVRVVPDARVDVYWAEGHLAALGVVHGPRILEVSGPSVRVQLRFGRTRIIGDPAALLPGEPVALTEYWGAQARGLEQVLSSSGDPREHLHRIEEILLRRAAQEPVDRLLLAAARRLARPHSTLGAVAGELDVSDRQLRRRFTHQLGFGPAHFIKLVRFRRFLDLLLSDDPPPLAAAAALAGYADQSHATRDCSELSGLPPAALLRETSADQFTAPVSLSTSRDEESPV